MARWEEGDEGKCDGRNGKIGNNQLQPATGGNEKEKSSHGLEDTSISLYKFHFFFTENFFEII
jgi:hypothetical protein